ncbi:MAG: cytochrome P450 [Hamadaea sp.]|nr:cytochrome P450 [Hamadaea sp.]NUR49499.1 cytochrome P450 [Hamadaea sp.]NUT06475.1 cytochrome P450 [Hamadaea sp.]
MARAVPGPPGQWLIGDVTAYQSDRLGWLATNRDRFGDVVRLSSNVIAVHHPELVHQVLAQTNHAYTVDNGLRAGRRERLEQQAHVAEWMAVRREIWSAIADQLTIRHAERFTARVTDELTDLTSSPFDLTQACRRLLGRALTDFCAGAEADPSRLETLAEAADSLFGTALQALLSHEGRVGWWPRPHAREAVRANRHLLDLLEELIRRRLPEGRPEQPRDLVDGLAAGVAAEADLSKAVSVLRSVMFASHGVPGAAQAWIALRLAEHAELSAAIAAEPDADDRYIGAFIKETLRLHPPQWLITRTTAERVRIGGYEIDRGVEVLLCPYLLHRDPRFWRDPERFDPARWLGTGQPHARHAYLPFGAGPRFCPGSQLATAQLTVVTRLLARDYRLKLPPVSEVRATTNGLLMPESVTARLVSVDPRKEVHA